VWCNAVSWDTKRGSGRYFYKSVRDGDRVRKMYAGKGEEAERLAREIEQRRQQLRAEREALQSEQLQMAAAEQALRALQDVADLLVQAVLTAGNCYKHNGQWRRRRSNVRDGDGDQVRAEA
jgi:hypothetical protein